MYSPENNKDGSSLLKRLCDISLISVIWQSFQTCWDDSVIIIVADKFEQHAYKRQSKKTDKEKKT